MLGFKLENGPLQIVSVPPEHSFPLYTLGSGPQVESGIGESI
jgi:hypothetical protein